MERDRVAMGVLKPAKPGPRTGSRGGRAARAAEKTAIANRRRRIAEMHLARVSQGQIASRLGVSMATVTKDLQAIREALRKEAVADMATATARQVAQLDRDEAKWRAKMKAARSQDQRLKIYDRVLQIVNVRSRLLGLFAPVRAEVSGPDGGPLEVTTHEYLERLARDPATLELGLEFVRRLDAPGGATGSSGGGATEGSDAIACTDPPGARAPLPGGAGEARDARAVAAAPAP